MYLLIAVLVIGVVTIKRSLDSIVKSTSNLEKYADDIYKKSKKFETIIENIKNTLQENDL